jgi:outer membrane protein assembly factor BamE (lipoprotein component of BamABCDE complex)
MKRAAGYVNRSCDARTSGLQERPSPDMTFRALAPSFRRTRSVTGTLRSTVAAMALGLVLVGCTGEQFQRGYILPPGALEQVQIGASQDQVLVVLGTPSTVATLDGDVFYYISQRTERKVAFMHQQVIDQRVIAVYFDKNRMVRRVANYGLKDGKIFDFISRTTPTGGQEISYLAPLFKLLRFRD